MQYVILDLEWNTAYSGRLSAFVNEVIEFGAVKLDENLNIIDSFSSFVKPQIEKKLRSRVKTLTNISNEDVANAEIFEAVSYDFSRWVGDDEDTVVMSWGDMDIRVLIDNYDYFCKIKSIPFVKKYVDLQAYFMSEKELSKGQQIGLSNAAALVEINPDEFVHHRALNDSELSAACFAKVFNEKTFNDAILTCDDDFYKRILFKPFIVSDINDKLVDKTLLNCQCLECGNMTTNISEWKFVNNSFTAMYYCNECKLKYRASVQIKKNFSQLQVKKTVNILKKNKK